jgi:tripartite ATP-independent transporter DctM subunit
LDPLILALLGLAVLFALIILHVPIGAAMMLTGIGGTAAMIGVAPAISLVSTEMAGQFTSLDLAVIPLFLLMGNLAGGAALSSDVYRFADALIGHRRGGLAYATIAGCAGFGAICGSSIATVAVTTRVALPEMIERRYQPRLAAGTIAAGGTLGILIPPSIVTVLYAVLTEQFVVELFIASLVPGLLAVMLYFAAVASVVAVDPDAGPGGPRRSWRERLETARGTWGALAMIAVVSGGIYGGLFTVAEAAGVGVVMAFVLCAAKRTLKRETFWPILFDTAATTGMLYFMILGATVFGYFITLTGLSQGVVSWIESLGLPPLGVIFALVAMYLVLGSVFDEIGAMILTLPFVFPLVVGLGYDPIWWGVVNVMIIEIGLIAPPIGMNVFVLHGMARELSLPTIYRGVTPFLVADLVRIVLLIVFPGIALWLPAVLK